MPWRHGTIDNSSTITGRKPRYFFMHKKITIVAVLFCNSNLALAETQLSLSPSLLHFDYTEFSTSNTVLDRETGWLPGFSLIFKDDINKQLHYEFEVAGHFGNVDYNGSTQLGTAHSTTTDESIWHIGFRLLVPYDKFTDNTTDLYIGIKRHEWQRNIHDNNNISGLYEVYKWWEISAGIQSSLWSNKTQRLTYDASLLYIYEPTIFVDLSRINRGSTTLNIGENYGGRLQLAWEQNNDPQWTYKLNTYAEFWDFGRSNTRSTKGGISTTVTEPRSETRNIGLQATIQYTF